MPTTGRGPNSTACRPWRLRRFNPEQRSWLPIHQTDRGAWFYRALYSNTALAHRLNRTHDWVVIYFTDGTISGQRTVVTETRGDLRGRRWSADGNGSAGSFTRR